MITLNGIEIKKSTFPDNTPYIKGEIVSSPKIVWQYEGMEELFDLMCLKDWMDKNGIIGATLTIPYLPNARMDKTMDPYETNNLQVMAKALNRMDFKEVRVLDVHSIQSMCIKNLVSVVPTEYIRRAIEDQEADVIFFPDKGASDRYGGIADELGIPYTFGKKTRDYNKRTVTRTVIDDPKIIIGKDVMIVDDICSKGSTFMKAYEALKNAKARAIALYVTHCEPNIMYGEVLDNMTVYSTNTLERLWRKKEGVEMKDTLGFVMEAKI